MTSWPDSKEEVIRFCLDIAEENIRRAEDPSLQPVTIAEIAAWFRRLLGEINTTTDAEING